MNHEASTGTKQRTRSHCVLLCAFVIFVDLAGSSCDRSPKPAMRRPLTTLASEEPAVFVADWANHRVVCVRDMQGTGWITLGDGVEREKAFRWPVGVCVDAAGRIYVAEQYH